MYKPNLVWLTEHSYITNRGEMDPINEPKLLGTSGVIEIDLCLTQNTIILH